MRSRPAVAGAGGIAFGVLLAVGTAMAQPLGGSYSAKAVTDFTAKGHRPAVFLSVYLVLAAVLGLVYLLAQMREMIGGDAARVFWSVGMAAAASFAIGFAISVAPALARAYAGSKASPIDPNVAYTISEAGNVVTYGVAGPLLGVALIMFGLQKAMAAPAWVGWFTVVAGVFGLASPAFFPSFILLLWSLVVGVWFLAARPAASNGAAEPRTVG